MFLSLNLDGRLFSIKCFFLCVGLSIKKLKHYLFFHLLLILNWIKIKYLALRGNNHVEFHLNEVLLYSFYSLLFFYKLIMNNINRWVYLWENGEIFPYMNIFS